VKTKYSFALLANRAKATLLLSLTIGLGGVLAGTAAAATSELLEQGLFAEETKGDLAAAIQFYQQAITEGQNDQTLTALAQYNLGVCEFKRQRFAEARAAFEKLVSDYPGQKELVAKANEYLAGTIGLLPAPWAEGEELRLGIKFQTGMKAGSVRYTVNADTLNGQKIWRFGSRMNVGHRSLSRVEVEADTCKPIHSRWQSNVLGDADTTYSAGHADVKLKERSKVTTVELNKVCYDNEEVAQLIRRLPLAPNYSTTLQIFTSLGGGNVIAIKLEVEGVESIQVPAGTFECFRVKLGLVNQTFWYSTDAHRYLVKFDAGAILAELTGVEQGKTGPSDAEFDVPTSEATAVQSNTDLVPKGWMKRGATPKQYEAGIDNVIRASGQQSAYLKGFKAPAAPHEFVTLMQTFRAGDYRGKRLRLSAQVKVEGRRGQAQLWMRVDSAKNTGIAFDNMYDRAIYSPSDWEKYSIVLDVPDDGLNIAFGGLFVGDGQAWFDDFRFEVVGPDVPATNPSAPVPGEQKVEPASLSHPVNLDFEEAGVVNENAGNTTPTMQPQNEQPRQNQAKLLMLAAFKLSQLPAADQWCEALNAGGSRLPEVPTNTVFAMNAAVAGHSLRQLPIDTVVFFETATPGWNQSGGAELLAQKQSDVAVAFADGRALLLTPAETKDLRWNP